MYTGPRPIEREFGLEHARISAGLRALSNSGGRIIQATLITHNEVGDLAQSVREG